MPSPTRTRNRRLEVRTTEEERELIDRAARAMGTDMSSFVITHLTDAARRVLAEQERFELDEQGLAEWERLNAEPARELTGLRRLAERPSPFSG